MKKLVLTLKQTGIWFLRPKRYETMLFLEVSNL